MSEAPGRQACLMTLESVGVSYASGNPFSREAFWALEDISFSLYHGETVGVLGKNGAGKSTLLQLLAGIINPDRGQIQRERGIRASLLALQLGFVPQISGRENAILNCILLGLSRVDARARVEKIFRFAEIEHAMDKPVSTYSAGMKARLGFGVAIEADPDILLVDEVLGVGDLNFRAKSKAVMQDKIRSSKTVVIVSHDITTLSELCDRLIYIADGKIIATGSPDHVISAYHSNSRQVEGRMSI